ncbi:MAG: acyltransferase family protein [Cypionkella sp.]|uniref:acyltransferase family protein n=1 Tax=Cypionkella sp. TaxID=2811411 RepID=UPI002AB8E14B|nr:acyltransferase family protein [Cypionkella sp.]MDZ4309195.1 acyltransferase family protein [Cypionkella sp.]
MSSAMRSRAVDVLKLSLAFMVVGIHANPFAPLGRTAILLTGDGLFRLGVPIFLLFNGYFLHAAVMQRRGWGYVKHAAQLYALWMLLYLPLYWPLLVARGPWQNLRTLLFGYWHLWYLAGMVMAAALIVAISRWSGRALVWVLALSFLGGIGVTYGMAFDLIAPNKRIFSDPLLANRNPLLLCLPFMLAGFLIARDNVADRLRLGWLQAAAVLGVALVLAESLLLARFALKGVAHDSMIALGLAAPALMVLALKWPGTLATRALSDYASGIYFIHVAFCALLFRFTDFGRPLIYAYAVAGSVLLTWGIRRAGLARRLL